jgi:hypothetical protein
MTPRARACVAAIGLAFAACIDRGFVGARDAAIVPAPNCEPGCAAGQQCLIDEARCVECLADADCSASLVGPRCDLALYACAPACEDDEDEPFDDDDDCELDEADGGDDDRLPDF